MPPKRASVAPRSFRSSRGRARASRGAERGSVGGGSPKPSANVGGNKVLPPVTVLKSPADYSGGVERVKSQWEQISVGPRSPTGSVTGSAQPPAYRFGPQPPESPSKAAQATLQAQQSYANSSGQSSQGGGIVGRQQSVAAQALDLRAFRAKPKPVFSMKEEEIALSPGVPHDASPFLPRKPTPGYGSGGMGGSQLMPLGEDILTGGRGDTLVGVGPDAGGGRSSVAAFDLRRAKKPMFTPVAPGGQSDKGGQGRDGVTGHGARKLTFKEKVFKKRMPKGLCPWCYGAGPLGASAAAMGVAAATLFTVLVLAVVLSLPETVSCFASDEAYYVQVIDRPTLEAFTPPMLCVAEGPVRVQGKGAALLDYNGNLPMLAVNGQRQAFEDKGGCKAVDVRGQEVQLCTSFSMLVPQDVSVANITNAEVRVADHKPEPPHASVSLSAEPCDFYSVEDLVLVPPPSIIDVWPAAICQAGAFRNITITGSYFTAATDAQGLPLKPSVVVAGTSTLVAASPTQVTISPERKLLNECTHFPVVGSSYGDIRHCDRMIVSLQPNNHSEGNNISIVNIPPADCTAAELAQFRVVPPPVVAEVSPPIVCINEDDQRLTIGHGSPSTFLRVDGRPPAVAMEGASLLVNDSAFDSLDDCLNLNTSFHQVRTCQRLRLTLPMNASIAELFYPTIAISPPYLDDCDRSFNVDVLEPRLLAVYPPPTVVDATPPAVCRSAAGAPVSVAGLWFLALNGLQPNVAVENVVGADKVVALVDIAVEDCVPFELQSNNASTCATLNLTLTGSDYAALGLKTLRVTNPSTAACTATSQAQFYVVADPIIDHVEPAVTCLDDAAQTLTIHGDGFYVYNDEVPAVVLDQGLPGQEALDPGAVVAIDCQALPLPLSASAHTLLQCTTLEITVLQRVVANTRLPSLTVSHPSFHQCGVTATDLVAFVPSPQVLELSPFAMCAGTQRSFDLDAVFNKNFLRVDTQDATVTVAGADLSAAAVSKKPLNCSIVAIASTTALQECSSLAFALDDSSNAYSVGALQVLLTNPPPADCPLRQATPPSLQLLAPPTVASVSPALTCLDSANARAVTLVGSSFASLDGQLPVVVLQGGVFGAGGQEQASNRQLAGACADLSPAFPVHTISSCTALELNVALPPSPSDPFYLPLNAAFLRPTIIVTPHGLDECQQSFSDKLTIVSEPTVSSLVPAAVCIGFQVVLKVTGTNLLFLAGGNNKPAVSISSDGTPYPVSAADVAKPSTGCSTVPVDGLTVDACTSVDITVDLTQAGIYGGSDADNRVKTVSLTNPFPADCALGQASLFDFALVDPPRVDTVSPPVLSPGSGAMNVTLVGAHFVLDNGLPPVVKMQNRLAQEVLLQSFAPADTSASCALLSAAGGAGALLECNELIVEIPQEEIMDLYVPSFTIDLANQQECTVAFGGVAEKLLTLLPNPSISSFSVTATNGAPTLCTAGSYVGAGAGLGLQVVGDHIYSYDGALPTVTLAAGAVTVADVVVDAANDCSQVTSVTQAVLLRCTRCTFKALAPATPPGEPSLLLSVTSSSPVLGTGQAAERLVVFQPSLSLPFGGRVASNSQSNVVFTVNGLALPKIGSVLPAVYTVGLAAGQPSTAVNAALLSFSACAATGNSQVELCDDFDLTVNADVAEVVVRNVELVVSWDIAGAGAANPTCLVSLPNALSLLPAPTVTSIGPPVVCGAEDFSPVALEVIGTFLLATPSLASAASLGAITRTLPAFTVGGDSIADSAITARGCDGGAAVLAQPGYELCTSLQVTWQPSSLPPANGISFLLRNEDSLLGAGSGPSDTDQLSVYFLPEPMISSFDPPIVCLSDGPVVVTMEGQNFLRVTSLVDDNTVTTPFFRLGVVAGGAAVLLGDVEASTSVCTAVVLGNRRLVDLEKCTTAVVTLPQQPSLSGIFQPSVNMTVTDNEHVQVVCAADVLDPLVVVTQPEFTGRPTQLCEEAGVQTVTINGAFFFETQVAGGGLVKPEVDLVDNNANTGLHAGANAVDFADISLTGTCVDLAVTGFDSVRYCDRMELQIDPLATSGTAPAVVQFANALRVTHPFPSISSCSDIHPHDLMSLPNPALASPFPFDKNEVCASDDPQGTDIAGVFYNYLGQASTVAVAQTSSTTVPLLSACTTLAKGTEEVEDCRLLSFTKPQQTPLYGEMPVDLSVASCTRFVNREYYSFPDPQPLHAETTSIREIGWTPLETNGYASPDDAFEWYAQRDPARVCILLTKNLHFEGSHFAGRLDPPPTRNAASFLTNVGQAVTVEYRTSDYNAYYGCSAQVPVAAQAASAANGDLELCTDFNVTLDAGALPVGYAQLLMKNSVHDEEGLEEEQCEGVLDERAAVRVLAVPKIEFISPQEYCVDQGGVVTIHGTDFDANPEHPDDPMQAFIYNARRNKKVLPNGGAGGSFLASWTVTSTSTAEMQLAPLLPEHGFNEIQIMNVQGCLDRVPNNDSPALNNTYLHIHPKIYIFYVNPPVTYDQINLQVTIFLSGMSWNLPDRLGGALVGEKLKRITLVHQDTGAGHPDIVYEEADILVKDGNFNRLQITVPVNVVAGKYKLVAESRIGCTAESEDLLEVLSDAVITVSDVLPKWVDTAVTTGVQVLGAGFVSTPTVYLNPQSGANPIAFLLSGTVFKSDGLLTTAVAKDTPVGTYQAVIINPDNTVGVYNDAVIVLPYEPPSIDLVNPATIVGGKLQTTIFGKNFDATGNMLSVVDCYQPRLATTTAGPIIGTPTTSITKGPESSTQVVATFIFDTVVVDKSMIACQVQLQTADGVITRYSAIVNANPNGKEKGNPYVEGIDQDNANLLAPKRGLVTLAGRINAASRYLFFIGGDSSVDISKPASPTDVVEYATFNQYGTVLTPEIQVYPLPQALAWGAGAKLGRFLYFTGGHDGTSPVNTIYRALILSPLETPAVTLDFDVLLNNTVNFIPGLDFAPGLYYYRVSAVFGPGDANNPDGESLPGDPLAVKVPSIAGALVKLSLTWPAVPNAVGYNLYRTSSPDAPFTALSLLKYVTGSEAFVDRGYDNEDTNKVPLVEGSTGKWATLSTSLTAARWGHGATIVPKPGSSFEFFLYVGKGSSGNVVDNTNAVNYLSSYEVWTITTGQDTADLGSPTQTLNKTGGEQSYPQEDGGGVGRMFVTLRTMCPNDITPFTGGGETDCAVYTSSGLHNSNSPTPFHNANPVTTANGVFDPTQGMSLNGNSRGGAPYYGSCVTVGSDFVNSYSGSEASAVSARHAIDMDDTIGTDNNMYYRLEVDDDVEWPGTSWNTQFPGQSPQNAAPAGSFLHSPVSFAGCTIENSLIYVAGGQNNNGLSDVIRTSAP